MESIPVFEINWIVSLVLEVLCSLNCLFLKKKIVDYATVEDITHFFGSKMALAVARAI